LTWVEACIRATGNKILTWNFAKLPLYISFTFTFSQSFLYSVRKNQKWMITNEAEVIQSWRSGQLATHQPQYRHAVEHVRARHCPRIWSPGSSSQRWSILGCWLWIDTARNCQSRDIVCRLLFLALPCLNSVSFRISHVIL
jgi:hypothetical protein